MVLNYRSLAGLSLLFALAACNMPFEQFPPPSDVQTAAALTLQAMLTPSITLPASETSLPTITLSPSPRVTETASTDSLTGTITTTYSVPMLTVLESTNCRTGPGEEYEVIFTYLTGKELEIVGRYEPTNFWLVKSNESPAGTCWLWGGFVELTGSYLAVPSVTPPPTTTPRPPRTPGIVSWEFFCSDGNLNFTAVWADNANDETGYRVFRNGEPIAELPPNTTTYTDIFAVSPNQRVEYYVQVYSPVGAANSSVMPMSC